jgi:hypothetical protein
MRKYLYEGRKPDGTPRRGYVRAQSAAEARQMIRDGMFGEAILLDDDNVAALRESGEKDGAPADLEVDIMTRYRPSAVALMFIAIKRNWLLGAVALAGLGWSLQGGHPAWGMVAVSLWAAAIVFPGWAQWEQNHMWRTFWAGDYAASERSARRLLAIPIFRAMGTAHLEIESRIAAARMKQGHEQEAMRMMQAWVGSERVPPMTPLIKLAELHFLARRWDEYLAGLERVLEASGEADYALIDVGQVSARLGDPARAEELLGRVDVSVMGALHHAFLDWGRGVLDLRRGRDEEALPKLARAAEHFQALGENPLTWGAISLCVGYLSVAMARTGRRAEARAMLASVAAIVGRHGEDRLLEWLQAEGMPVARA